MTNEYNTKLQEARQRLQDINGDRFFLRMFGWRSIKTYHRAYLLDEFLLQLISEDLKHIGFEACPEFPMPYVGKIIEPGIFQRGAVTVLNGDANQIQIWFDQKAKEGMDCRTITCDPVIQAPYCDHPFCFDIAEVLQGVIPDILFVPGLEGSAAEVSRYGEELIAYFREYAQLNHCAVALVAGDPVRLPDGDINLTTRHTKSGVPFMIMEGGQHETA